MRYLARIAAVAVISFSLWSTPALAQDDDQPAFHYLTVTTYSVPLGGEGNDVMMWIDSVVVPLAKLNPNVESFMVGRHAWGSNSGHVIMISRYATWEAINAPCGEPCQEWNEANEPEEGSEREAMWNEVLATFLKYNTGHNDEIYAVPVTRMK